MIRTPPAVLLYDWDNTLVDAWAGITAALNAVFREFEMELWSNEETRARVRVSLRESFPLIFGDQWQRARDIFYATLEAEHLRHIQPMAGAAEALRAGNRWAHGVVSNKAGRFLRAEVAHLGWAEHFVAVIGAGDASADKPDPAPIRLALARMGEAPGPHVWYLGDTALDMQTARAAGVVPVLLGDAAHDGGVAHAAPRIHFASAHAVADYLTNLSDPVGLLK